MTTTINFSENDRIAELLIGCRVTAVDVSASVLTLDDGTVVEVVPNEGDCSCSAGDYELIDLATVDNAITSVELVNDPAGDDDWDYKTDSYTPRQGYRIFVYAGDERINLMHVDGNDGNGYYGTGYQLIVRKPLGAPDGPTS